MEPIEQPNTENEQAGFMENLMQTAADNAPRAMDDQYPRYGMSFLLPLPLYYQTGANTYGDFNPKNPDGSNRVNVNYYPAFELVALYGVRAKIPFEVPVTYTDSPIAPQSFDQQQYEVNPGRRFEHITRTAKECSVIAEREFRDTGYHGFRSLTGYRLTDEDKGLRAVYELLNLILPLKDESVFPKSIRIKGGVAFASPFLDEIDRFLSKESLRRIFDAPLDGETKAKASEFYGEIRAGVMRSVKLANTILNETEAEIKNPNAIKKAYDIPNLDTPDAPAPTDLYCLAHTNRTELDDKQLAASATIGREISDPVTRAVEKFTEALGAQARTQAPPATAPKNVLTEEEVQVLLERQRLDMEAAFEEKMNQFADRFAPPVQVTASEGESVKRGGGKTKGET